MENNEVMKLRKFGNFIKDRMNGKGITMKQFAHDSGLSYGYISNVIHCRRGIPKPETIDKIAKGLGIGESTLYDLADIKPNSQNTESLLSVDHEHNRKFFSYKGKHISDDDAEIALRLLDGFPDADKK